MKRIGIALAALLAALPWTAHARGTAAGTNISNSVSLGFTVKGITQNNVQSNTVNFVVDHAVDVAVTTLDAAAVSVTPAGTNYVLTFKVTNLSNDKQDFALSAVAVAAGKAAKFGGTDNADMNNVRVFVDANGNGTYDAGTDTATFIDELAADASATVFIVADAPPTLANGDIASYHLVATAHKGNTPNTLGAVETQTSPASQTLTGVDTLFVDGKGTIDGGPNGKPDGKHSDQDDYKVVSAVISVSKSAAVADPYGSKAAVPGATVTYTITVSNAATAGAPAVLTTLTDTLNANLAYVNGSASWKLSNGAATDAGTGGATLTGSTLTFNISNFLTKANTPNTTGAGARAAGELKPGETLTLTFQTKIK